LLKSTRVAGVPKSYFRKQDEDSLALEWGVCRQSDGQIDFADFIRRAISAGSTENGVFAARIMWGTMEEVVENLDCLHQDLVGDTLGLLNRAFDRVRFVYLYRKDSIAQAVSWARAEKTDTWHDLGDGEAVSKIELTYDFDEIHNYVELIDAHHAAWRLWFDSLGVRPYELSYEALDLDPVGTTQGVLGFLGLHVPRDRTVTAGNRRLADSLSANWITSYRANLKTR